MVEVLLLVACMAILRYYSATRYHCGLGVSRAYLRQIEHLTDPNDTADYREYVVRPWQFWRWQLWRMGVKIERIVFGETDHNTPFELWFSAIRYLCTTSLVIGVDQRRAHAPYPVPYGMIRVSRGSIFGLTTLKGVKSKKYWHTLVRRALRIARMPWYAPYVRRSWDITMIAVLKPYRGKTSYTDYTEVTMGLLAQTCQLSEDYRLRWWFTILARGAFFNIQRHTGRPWEFIFDPKESWMSYFGSKGSQPFFCHFQEWIWRLFTEDRETFIMLFRDGLGPAFRYERRRAVVRNPVRPAGYPEQRPDTHRRLPEATAA